MRFSAPHTETSCELDKKYADGFPLRVVDEKEVRVFILDDHAKTIARWSELMKAEVSLCGATGCETNYGAAQIACKPTYSTMR